MYTPFSRRLPASSALISFWVADGNAASAGIAHSGFVERLGSTGVNVALGYCSVYCMIRPRRRSFRSITHASFSRSIPSLS